MEGNLGQRNSNSCVTLRRGESNVSSNLVSEVNSCELKRTNRKQSATIVNAESEEFKKLVQNPCKVDREIRYRAVCDLIAGENPSENGSRWSDLCENSRASLSIWPTQNPSGVFCSRVRQVSTAQAV